MVLLRPMLFQLASLSDIWTVVIVSCTNNDDYSSVASIMASISPATRARELILLLYLQA